METDTVVVGSYETRLELTCRNRLADGSADSVEARIIGPGLDAIRNAYEFGGYEGLASFFEAMSEAWRGWDDVRAFSTLEGDLGIEATHDGRHVTLRVQVRRFDSPEWEAQATVRVDPGEDLASAARSVRALVGRPGTA